MISVRRLLLPTLSLLFIPALAAPQAAVGPVSSAADFVRPGKAVPLPPPLDDMVRRVQGVSLAAHVRFLASPSLEGRGLGSNGLEATAEYVAASLALAGIPPTAGSSYFQEVPIRRVEAVRASLRIEPASGATVAPRVFAAGAHVSFPEIAPQVVRGQIVFAGYGIREPTLGRDDYRGLDPRGKIVVVLGGLPPGHEWQTPALESRYGRYAAKLETAAALGARALLGVEPPAAWAKSNTPVPSSYFVSDDPPEPLLPLVLVDDTVARAVLGSEAARVATGARRRGAGRVTATIRIAGSVRRLVARNVVGVLTGADPALREEAVVVGAHMDHLGSPGGRLHPGADDNASGVAALLEIARALAAAPVRPKRSIVFAFWTGEEEGHFGSEFYVRHRPLWPLSGTSAYVNLDMIGHPWLREEIDKLVQDAGLPGGSQFVSGLDPSDFVEPGVAAWAPELCSILERAARGLGLSLHFDRTDGASGGSDYRAFARHRVRFIRFFGNFFPGYHEPSDTVASLDVQQAAKVARLALATVWHLAEP